MRQKLISSWNKPVEFYLEGQKMSSKGSDITSFSTLRAALRNVMKSDMMGHKTEGWYWDIHGFRPINSDFKSVESHQELSTLNVIPLDEVASADQLDWENCHAFIVPDHEEETFNYLALTAIWLGIPTLASSQSSIGKFLLSLSGCEASRAIHVVPLLGNAQHDREVWTKKIREVLGQDSRPTEGAQQLTLYLQSNNDLWELNLPSLKNNPRLWLSASLNASLFAKQSGQISRSYVLDEVAKKLERSHFSENNVDAKHSGISSVDSQVCYYSHL